jgi:hypothetical protein
MGLIGGIAKTAIASGTWTAVSNGVSRRQANRWAQQDQQAYEPAAAPAAAPAPDPVAQLKDLADLKAQGILTEEEFAAQKAKILAG